MLSEVWINYIKSVVNSSSFPSLFLFHIHQVYALLVVDTRQGSGGRLDSPPTEDVYDV